MDFDGIVSPKVKQQTNLLAIWFGKYLSENWDYSLTWKTWDLILFKQNQS